MIDFRYHLVSLVSVFLALAVGIVLGAGPLKGTISDTLNAQVEQLRKDRADLNTQVKTEQNALANRDTFTRTVLPSLVDEELPGIRVLLVTVPGVDADTVTPLTESLRAAGATVTGQVDVKDAWSDPGRVKDRESVIAALTVTPPPSVTPAGTVSPTAGAPTAGAATAGAATGRAATSIGRAATATGTGGLPPATSPASLTPSPTGRSTPTPSLPHADPTSARLAALLGRALMIRGGNSSAFDPTAKTLLEALRKAGLIGVNGDLSGRATEAVVLVPGVDPAAASNPSATASGTDPAADWASLAVGLDTVSDGVVVTGPATSATSGGVIALVRGEQKVAAMVSSVDTGSTPMGDVSTVYALREQELGGAGSYGFVGKVDGPVPSRSAAVRP